MDIQVELQIPLSWYLKQPFHDLLLCPPSNWLVKSKHSSKVLLGVFTSF